MSAEKAKEARARLMDSDPGLCAGIDGLKSIFGAKLTALQVGDIVLGEISRVEIWEQAPPLATYRRPEEIIAEWKEIKASTTGSRRGSAPRAGGGRRGGGRR